jgi:hypothetical protein
MLYRNQHVACIDDKNYVVDNGNLEPRKGQVYTVAVYDGTGYPEPAVQLQEFPPDQAGPCWYKASRFRPLTKLKVEDFVNTGAPILEELESL